MCYFKINKIKTIDFRNTFCVFKIRMYINKYVSLQNNFLKIANIQNDSVFNGNILRKEV